MINYGRQWIDEEDIAAVFQVLRSDFLTQGPAVQEFEQAWAKAVEAEFAVAVANGTAALHLAVAALMPEPGIDKHTVGITAPNTFVASANCLVYNGLTPDFADIDVRTYCLDPLEVDKRLTPDTKIVIPVHFAGQSCDMAAFGRLRQKREIQGTPLYIIEDACHAVGSTHRNGKPVGSCCFSDMAVFSCHPVKTVATGEGGMITTNNKHLYDRLIMLRTHGITKDSQRLKNKDQASTGPWYYEMQSLGFNYRLTDMQAALGTSQLKKLDKFKLRRREIVAMYNDAFKGIDWLALPYEHNGLESAFHLYVLLIDFEGIHKSRTQVMHELREKGIGTQVHYIPVHLQPYYRENYRFKPGDFPKAEQYYKQCLSIPLYPAMDDEDVQTVIAAIKSLVE